MLRVKGSRRCSVSEFRAQGVGFGNWSLKKTLANLVVLGGFGFQSYRNWLIVSAVIYKNAALLQNCEGLSCS